jgi:hypothetical protein
MSKINDRWSASSFMMPQHLQALQQQRQAEKKYTKPEIDEQQWEEWSRMIEESMNDFLPIIIWVAESYGPEPIRGHIVKVDPYSKLIRLGVEETTVTIPFSKIAKMEW